VWKALTAPAYWIAQNAGIEGNVAIQQAERETGATGLNAATGEFEDLVKAGVIDPAKVTRAALQNAASIASLLLTTEALVGDKPEPVSAAPAGPPGGGHGRHGRHGGHGLLGPRSSRSARRPALGAGLRRARTGVRAGVAG
jgi:chaperonin GroEL